MAALPAAALSVRAPCTVPQGEMRCACRSPAPRQLPAPCPWQHGDTHGSGEAEQGSWHSGSPLEPFTSSWTLRPPCAFV